MDEDQVKTNLRDLQIELERMKQLLENTVSQMNDLSLRITNNESRKVELSNLMKGFQIKIEETKQCLENFIIQLNEVILLIATKMEGGNCNETVEKCIGTSDYQVDGE